MTISKLQFELLTEIRNEKFDIFKFLEDENNFLDKVKHHDYKNVIRDNGFCTKESKRDTVTDEKYQALKFKYKKSMSKTDFEDFEFIYGYLIGYSIRIKQHGIEVLEDYIRTTNIDKLEIARLKSLKHANKISILHLIIIISSSLLGSIGTTFIFNLIINKG